MSNHHITLATALNPEAGYHQVTSNPAEQEAAERAVQRSWAQFPYYARRYGHRGRRFSASDSGWLVTLCDQAEGHAMAQTRWLGSVLSSRGMPQWMLECHLELLHEELVAAHAQHAERYARLLACAAALRDDRRSHVSEDDFAELEAAFDAAVGPERARKHRRTGGILVAAVADERHGIAQAVESVEAYVCDPSQFEADWIAAARRTIADARARAR